MKYAHSILTVGSMAFDSIRTPAGKADKVLGGSVNYFSVAASFHTPVQVLGVVGKDFPQSHLDWLQARNIDVHGVERADGETFHWVGSYDGNLNEAQTLSTFLNVFEHFNPKLSADHKKSPVVFLANIDPVLQQRVLDQVHDPKFVACDSMNFWITGKLEELKKTLRRVDMISINEGEATLLSGQKNLIQAARAVQSMGPSVVIIKRGEYGAVMVTRDSIFIAPAYPVDQVVDPTGAGDSFAGAMMGTLAAAGIDRKLETHDPKRWNQILRRAMINGCTMASFTVEDFSLHRLMRLQPEELKEREQALLKMIAVE